MDPGTPRPIPRANGATRKVLVVDDSPTSLAFATRLLESAGFEVETSDTVWISAQVNRFRPDLVLMDVNLGVSLTGTAAIRALKDRPFAQRTRFVLYSDLSKAELSQKVKECGADGFICKQDTDELLPEVRRLLEREPSHSTGRSEDD